METKQIGNALIQVASAPAAQALLEQTTAGFKQLVDEQRDAVYAFVERQAAELEGILRPEGGEPEGVEDPRPPDRPPIFFEVMILALRWDLRAGFLKAEEDDEYEAYIPESARDTRPHR